MVYEHDVGVVLVSGSGRSTQFTTRIQEKLVKFYTLGSLSAPLITDTQEDMDSRTFERNGSYPFFIGRFPDGEVRAEGGREFLERVNSNQVVIVKDFLDDIEGKSIDDHVSEVKCISDLVHQFKPAYVTLVTPYFPYVRSHSYTKHNQRGFYEANRLRILVQDLAAAGISEIVTIDPHEKLLIQKYCTDGNIELQALNPFQSSTSVNPDELGLRLPYDEIAAGIIHKQTPFVAHYLDERRRGTNSKDNLPKLENTFVIIPDDGSYERGYTFAVESHIGADNLLRLQKNRVGVGSVRDIVLHPESRLKLEDIVSRPGIIIDDLIAKGTTSEGIAHQLKDAGASRIEAWVTVTNNPRPDTFNSFENIDRIIALECNRQMPIPEVGHPPKYPILFYISGMTSMLSAAIKRRNLLLNG